MEERKQKDNEEENEEDDQKEKNKNVGHCATSGAYVTYMEWMNAT